jgi:hypothetical protein
MNNSPYVYDVVRLRAAELAAEARHAKLCRELAGPSFMRRLVSKVHRSTSVEQRRLTQPVVAESA